MLCRLGQCASVLVHPANRINTTPKCGFRPDLPMITVKASTQISSRDERVHDQYTLPALRHGGGVNTVYM